MEPFFIQGQTLHDGGGLTVEQNGRFVQICLGDKQQAQAAFSSSDCRKIIQALKEFSARTSDNLT